MEKKRVRTDASRKADKKYNEKRITFSIGYRTKEEYLDGLRFKTFLESKNYSANAYIKELIKRDMDANQAPYPESE